MACWRRLGTPGAARNFAESWRSGRSSRQAVALLSPPTPPQDGSTCLHYACARRHEETAEALVAMGADLDAADDVSDAPPTEPAPSWSVAPPHVPHSGSAYAHTARAAGRPAAPATFPVPPYGVPAAPATLNVPRSAPLWASGTACLLSRQA